MSPTLLTGAFAFAFAFALAFAFDPVLAFFFALLLSNRSCSLRACAGRGG
jgi:hypothetical protein